MTKLQNWLLALALALAAGAAGGWYLSRPKIVPEPPAPAVRQADGSLVLERGSESKESLPKPVIPEGGKVERRIQVTVQPRPNAGSGLKVPPVTPGELPAPKSASTEAQICPPVSVDLALVRMPDDTRRVVASSPDGEVVGGLDVPVEPTISSRSSTWSTGLSYDPIKQTPGAWVERDMGPLRIGLDLNQTRVKIGGETGTEARLRVGWSW